MNNLSEEEKKYITEMQKMTIEQKHIKENFIRNAKLRELLKNNKKIPKVDWRNKYE